MVTLHLAHNNRNRTSSYPYFCSALHYDVLTFLMQLKDIVKFDKMNGLRMNVYCVEQQQKSGNNKIAPIYSNNQNSDRSVIHFLILETDNNHFYQRADDDDNDDDDDDDDDE